MTINFEYSRNTGVTFRTLREQNDIPLLFEIFKSTREEILAFQGWNKAQKDSFLNQQFYLQHNAYMKSYNNAVFYIISHGSKEVGRLYIDIGKKDLRIIDIALLPHARGQGIGEAVLSDILAWAKEQQKKVSIHVERQNPAQRLYKRMGFNGKASGSDVYILMEKDAA